MLAHGAGQHALDAGQEFRDAVPERHDGDRHAIQPVRSANRRSVQEQRSLRGEDSRDSRDSRRRSIWLAAQALIDQACSESIAGYEQAYTLTFYFALLTMALGLFLLGWPEK